MKVVHPGGAEKLGLRATQPSAGAPRMNMHKNARLTPAGRALMVRRIDEGWSPGEPPMPGSQSEPLIEWLKRHRAGEGSGPQLGATRAARAGCRARGRDRAPRRQRLTGPQIAAMLAMARSTVGLVLRRLGLAGSPSSIRSLL